MCSLEPTFLNSKTNYLNVNTSSKGTWMTIILNALVAKIHCFALASNTSPSIFIFANSSECYGTSYKNSSEAACVLLIKKLKNIPSILTKIES